MNQPIILDKNGRSVCVGNSVNFFSNMMETNKGHGKGKIAEIYDKFSYHGILIVLEKEVKTKVFPSAFSKPVTKYSQSIYMPANYSTELAAYQLLNDNCLWAEILD